MAASASTSGRVPSSLIRKLSTAAEAASVFSLACKRALSSVVDNNSSQPVSVLSEYDLMAWREASEPLLKQLPISNDYFVPRSLFVSENASYLAQVDAVNLALVLEMFLPSDIRNEHPKWTTRIPLVDDTPSQPSIEQQISEFKRPLNELKSMYLHLCAGRKEKHITYIIRGLLLDLCTTSVAVVKNAQHESTFKAEDLVAKFDSSFLRHPSLVPSVFATQTVQNKAVTTWSSEGGARIRLLQAKPQAGDKYTWDNLCEVVLRDALKNLVPSLVDKADAERVANKSVPKGPAKTATTATIDEQVNQAKNTQPRVLVPGTPSITTSSSNPTQATRTTQPTQSSETNIPSQDVVQFPVIDSHVSAPPARRDAEPEPDLEPEPFPAFAEDTGADMMEYVQDFGEGSEDGEGEDVEPVMPPRPPAPLHIPVRERKIPAEFRFNAPQATAHKIRMTPSPPRARESSTPEDVRATSMLRKIKKTVTADNDRNRTISTSTTKSKDSFSKPSRTKARPDPFEEILNNMDEEDENIVSRKTATKKKRKVVEEEEDANDARKTKKRKVGEMAPPIVPSKKTAKSTGSKSSATTAPAQPYAARHSSASTVTLVNGSELAGPSSAAVRIPPNHASNATTDPNATISSKPKPKPNQVYAATSSDSEADLGSRARQNAQKRAKFYNRNKVARTAVTQAPSSRPTAPISLEASDRRMMDSKARVAELRSITQKEKANEAKLKAADKEARKEEDPDATEESSSDDEYQDAQSHASEELDDEEALRRSKERVAAMRKEAEKYKMPVQRRGKHLPVADEEYQEEEEEEEEEEAPVEVKPRKRGRPRKVIQSSADEAPAPPPRAKVKNKYATGGNADGRVRWTEEEDKTLLFAIEAVYYSGSLLKPWKQVLDRHGAEGTDDHKLERRNYVQVKDRARNIAKKYAAQGKQIPVFLSWIKLSDKQIKT